MKLTPTLDKTVVKFNEKGQLLVDVPYKNGSVTWGLSINPSNSKMRSEEHTSELQSH